LLSSLPHATKNIASETTNAAANLFRATIKRTFLLLKPWVPRGSPPYSVTRLAKSQWGLPTPSPGESDRPAISTAALAGAAMDRQTV
jgi:hypothetical protein